MKDTDGPELNSEGMIAMGMKVASTGTNDAGDDGLVCVKKKKLKGRKPVERMSLVKMDTVCLGKGLQYLGFSDDERGSENNKLRWGGGVVY